MPEIPLEVEQHVLIHAVEIDTPRTREFLESDERSLVFVGGTQRPFLAQILDLAPEKGVHIAIVVTLTVGRGDVADGKRPPFAFQFGEDTPDLQPLVLQKYVDIPDEGRMRFAPGCNDSLLPCGIEVLGQQTSR